MWQYPQTEVLCKGSGKEVKIQEFMYRDTTNVEPEMYNYTSNNTDIQPKISIDEISLLWLFCGC